MSLPYENATSGDKAIGEIQKILRAFGCTKFGTGEDYETGELFVQFEHRDRRVMLKASAQGYAAAWLKAHPFGPRSKGNRADHEARALRIGGTAVYSVLRDWIKGQVTAIEIGMMTFDAAFLPHILLGDGSRVIEHVERQRLLPKPEGQDTASTA